MQKELVLDSFLRLKQYVEKEEYKGWDPYDGLNSKVYQQIPFSNWKYPRWFWIQLFKRNPFNLRDLLRVPKDYNTKGIGLFLHGYCQLYKLSLNGIHEFGNPEELKEKIDFLGNLLIELRSPGYSGFCWGYNFDWQNRVFFQPKGTPTVVATSFVANALHEAYLVTKEEKYLNGILSSCKFICEDLNRTEYGNGKFIFSYSPLDKSQVYNASLLGARLLAQGYVYTKNEEWLDLSQRAVKTIMKLQDNKGGWVYGAANNQQWIDSFHTGFNLECISDYMNYTGDKSFEKELQKGTNYYLHNFFLTDGTPKYYHNHIYPIDIHSPAQFIITLIKLNKLEENIDLAEKVLNYTIHNMQDKEGYFYYQLKKGISSKIPYMRWAQAWMFYTFANFILIKTK
ncbi:delta-aminolevulinic acid dehydratase [Shivajiella indica]|uniref:Delta-aminolevulinic acid dehydratase n=1 Tax=Shivajiella indica TaxID=872115 RepID=A0ABW5BB73_9BACT